MILAGEQIDEFFGVRFGLSVMAAAGLGNLVSDVIGTGLEGTIKRSATATALPPGGINEDVRRSRAW